MSHHVPSMRESPVGSSRRPSRVIPRPPGAGTAPRAILLWLLHVLVFVFLFGQTAVTARSSDWYRRCLRLTEGKTCWHNPCSISYDMFTCRTDFTSMLDETTLNAVPALLVGTGLLFLGLSLWHERSGRLVPVPDPAGRLRPRLVRLTAQAGLQLDEVPRFLTAPRALTAGAVAHGWRGGHTVVLHAGLVARHASDPATFDAVVLHELAHVRNEDVAMGNITLLLWRVVLFFGFLPYFAIRGGQLLFGRQPAHVHEFWAHDWPRPAELLSVCALAVLLRLACASLLRRRELSADLDAVSWGAHPGVWHTAEEDSRTARRRRGGLRALSEKFTLPWSLHPSWGARCRSLRTPRRGILRAVLLFTGVAAALAHVVGYAPPDSFLGVFGADSSPDRALFVLHWWLTALGLAVLVVGPLVAPLLSPRPFTAVRAAVVTAAESAARRLRSRGSAGTDETPGWMRSLPSTWTPRPLRYRLIAWLDAGGGDVIKRLDHHLTVYRSLAAYVREGTGTETHRHRRETLEVSRRELRDVLAEGRALPSFPDPRRRELWQRTLAAVESGNRAADQAGPDGTSDAALRAAERGYAAARRSCRTLCAAYWNIPAMTRRLYPVVARTARQENHR